MAEESKFTVTLKSGTAHDAAWLVVRGDTPVEIQSDLAAIEQNGLGAVIASADKAFKAAHAAGSTLGATPVAAPVNSAAPPAQQAEQSNPWQSAQQPQQDANPWGQSQGQRPQWGQPPSQSGQTFDSGQAPIVLGMPARAVTGASKKTGKPWSAWADQRPKEVTQNIQDRTDDPNDPRLAQGTATFWKWRD